jgi:hypothetical protein
MHKYLRLTIGCLALAVVCPAWAARGGSLQPVQNLMESCSALAGATSPAGSCALPKQFCAGGSSQDTVYRCGDDLLWHAVSSASAASGFAADPSNCSTGYAAGGVTATGVAENCVDVTPGSALDVVFQSSASELSTATTSAFKFNDGTGTLQVDGAPGIMLIGGAAGAGSLVIEESTGITAEGGTANAYETTLSFEDPTADSTVTVPDKPGTLIAGVASLAQGGTGAETAQDARTTLEVPSLSEVVLTTEDVTKAGVLTLSSTPVFASGRSKYTCTTGVPVCTVSGQVVCSRETSRATCIYICVETKTAGSYSTVLLGCGEDS